MLSLVLVLSWWLNRGTLAAEGQKAPDFDLPVLNGSRWSLSDHQGQSVCWFIFSRHGAVSAACLLIT